MARAVTLFSRLSPWKAITAFLLPLLLLGGFLLLLSQRPPTAPVLTASGESANPANPTVLAADEAPLAVVNAASISSEALAGALAIDRALSRLLGAEIAVDPQATLERLVNGLLVAQAAAQAGFALDDGQIDTALANLLAGAGQDEAGLVSALAEEGIGLTDFRTAFAQLLLADRFARQQAEAQGVEASAYLRSLQKEARISFGPAVAGLTETTLPAPAAAAAQAAAAQTTEEKQPSAAAESQPAPSKATGPEWQLLPFVADPAFAAPKEETASALTGSSSAGSVEQIVTGTASGNFAPDFRAPLAIGDGELALADLVGKPTLLSFWTTWCPYCLRQTPLLVEAHSRWAEAGVNFAGVNVGEASAQVLPYLESQAIDYPNGLDESGAIAAAYAVRGFPTTYFLDAEGRVVARHVGQLSAEEIDSYLNQITQMP